MMDLFILTGLAVGILMTLILDRIHRVGASIIKLEQRLGFQDQRFEKQEDFLVARIAELKTENENLRHQVSQRL